MQLFMLPLFFLVLIACNQGNPNTGTDPSDSKNEGGGGPAPTAVTMAGTLDTLYIDTADFNKLPNGKKVMFSFAFRTPDLLTLHGWISNGNCNSNDSINKAPDVKLLKWRTGSLSINQNIYLGNVFIDQQDIKKIKDFYNAATTKSKYVVFAPRIDAEHIVYKIFVTNDAPKPLTLGPSPSFLNDTNLDANPSPPKSL